MKKGSGGSFESVSMSAAVQCAIRRRGSQPFAKLIDAVAAVRKQARHGDELRSAVADLGNQRVDRPHAGQPRAEQVAIEQADPFGFVERRKDLIVAQSVAEMRCRCGG